jgi:hypothetical protein
VVVAVLDVICPCSSWILIYLEAGIGIGKVHGEGIANLFDLCPCEETDVSSVASSLSPVIYGFERK